MQFSYHMTLFTSCAKKVHELCQAVYRYQNSCDTDAIMPDSVPKMYDTGMIHNDTDTNIMDDSG